MDLKRRETPQAAGTTTERAWKLSYLTVAAKEGRKFLSDAQYSHAVSLCEQLRLAEHPTHPVGLDVKSIENFYELRDKGGVLGKINLRVFFVIHDDLIVILGCFKKEAEGKTPSYIKIQMRTRIRFVDDYLANSSGGDE